MYDVKLFWTSDIAKIIAQNLKGQVILESASRLDFYSKAVNINFYWNSDPVQVVNKRIKGQPILTFDFGIFKTQGGSATPTQPAELISSDTGNHLNLGSDGKLYIDDVAAGGGTSDDTNFLLLYTLSKG